MFNLFLFLMLLGLLPFLMASVVLVWGVWVFKDDVTMGRD